MNATKAVMQDGYFKTGDIARYDGCGWMFIEGRISELITVQGFPVSPRELEEVIMMHPFVKDTAVIGNDKEVVACVITKADTKLDDNKLLTYIFWRYCRRVHAAIFRFISERLPVQKWPTRISFMMDFPTTPLGKVRRDFLREEVLTVKIEHSESDKHIG
jgi:acyl-CoA synthetase (AMP-forming)/AMP-acid ligase II